MNPLNPFQDNQNFFMGKTFLGFTDGKSKPMSHSRMKMKQIAKRRKRNKAAARSRRINRIRQELDRGTKRQPKKKNG